MYEDSELEDFIDLYKETFAVVICLKQKIVDEHFDGTDFEMTGYIKITKLLKFHPSELIDFRNRQNIELEIYLMEIMY